MREIFIQQSRFFENRFKKKLINDNLILNLDFDYKNSLEIDLINYKKNEDSLQIYLST